ncbi:hypothetical protein [Candidatus Xianfuyuplasma coldseepsis]|uniref:Uncharacterized protein n=1 Tax=Candidatus Xianfuyuplasma coldseepsis TaxID=2782163 RepID=A0A7L7KTF3_9MOLU|nr:hypothetical protein [Xianfuyuplasma coldseepsis]QMS85689.1 hypothetical protein G4Z02_08015 [Xianfuyuplasma coldseepsis]
MPTSRKRAKKPKQEVEVKKKTANITKSKWGKAIILILALGFVLSIVAGTVLVLFQAWNA